MNKRLDRQLCQSAAGFIIFCVASLTAAATSFTIDSLDGDITSNELKQFTNSINSLTPPVNNYGDSMSTHGTPVEGMRRMYEATGNMNILNRLIAYCDIELVHRNDQPLGDNRVMWTGNVEPGWPEGSTNTTPACTTGMIHGNIAYCAKLILETPSIWNQTVPDGNPYSYGVTYKQRATNYLAKVDSGLSAYLTKWFVDTNTFRIHTPSDSRWLPASGGDTAETAWNRQALFVMAYQYAARCHDILGDNPSFLPLYKGVVNAFANWFIGVYPSGGGVYYTTNSHSVAKWYYQIPTDNHIENIGHAQHDVIGLYQAWESGYTTLTFSKVQVYADTAQFVINLGSTNSWSLNVDGSGTPGGSLKSDFVFLGQWNRPLYKMIAQSNINDNQINSGSEDCKNTGYILWMKHWMFLNSVSNFSLTVTPGSQTVIVSNATSFAVSVGALNGFTNAVSLSLSNLPANVSASFSPASVNPPGSSTLNGVVSNDAAPGIYPLTIRGIGGGITNSGSVNLVISTGVAAAAGTLVWTGASGTDTNWLTALNWTNLLVSFGPPGTNNSVLFTNLATASASALTSPGSGVVNPANINNFVNTSFTILGMTNLANAVNTSPVYHNLGIASGATLITGGLQVGGFTQVIFADNNVVNLTVSGAGGALQMTNGGLTVSEDATNGPANNATLDLSGLDTFAMTGTQIRIGVEGGGSFHHASGIIYLAKTNSLTLTSAGYSDTTGSGSPSSGNPAFYIGHNASAFGSGSKLYLGINNSINLDYATIGRGDTNALVAFNPAFLASSPSVTIRGTNGGSTRVGVYVVGDGSAGAQANNAPSTNDFTGGTVDAMINYLCVGRGRSGNSSTTGSSGVLTFNNGTIDVNTLAVGFIYPSGSNSPATGTVNVNGGTLVVNSNIFLAQSPGVAGQTAFPQGTLNINGGTVVVNTIVNGGGTATVSANGGTLVLAKTMGTAARAINTLNLTNAILHFQLDGNSIFTNIFATNFAVAGVTEINIDSVSDVTATNRFPLIKYTTLNGSVANFAVGGLPVGFAGRLNNNLSSQTIDLIVAPLPLTRPIVNSSSYSVLNGTLIISGTNGRPGETYSVLASTNLTLPVTNWNSLGSDVFDGNGNFIFTIDIDPNLPQQFYLLQSP
jgi:hypothetical protein